MSTDWNVYCLDCKDTCRFNDANHRTDLMHEIIRLAPAFAALGKLKPKRGDFDFRTNYGWVDLDFFVKHEGHKLVPISEYGEVDGTCAKSVECQQCDCWHHKCPLPVDHKGDCALPQRKP